MQLIPKKRTAPEFMDLVHDAYDLEVLEGSLADIRVVNRYLGDQRALLKHLSLKTAGMGTCSILDIATGSADLPVAIADWAAKTGMRANITGVDINEHTIGIARTQTAGYCGIKLEVADALSLPYPDRSFDFVICSKTTHHLDDQDVVRLIREMLRVARRGYIIMDLRRSWIAWALITLLTRLFTRNRMTRHDGPLSVLKSFTPIELAAFASSAGASDFTVHKEPFWLLVLSGDVR